MSYVFLDIETTGLCPVNDHILQIAIQVTDDALNEIGEPFVSDVALTEAAASRLYMNPYVRDMHTRTGLLGRLESTLRAGVLPDRDRYTPAEARLPRDLLQAEMCARAHLRNLPDEDPDATRFTIAGNSVHFDLAFLRHHMPRLAAMFSHRIMDVSVLRMFEDRHGSGAIDGANTNAHDALADVKCSIEQMRGYVKRRDDLARELLR